MKICFVNLPVRTSAPPNNVPLGIYYLGTDLKQQGYDVVYVDLNLYRPEITLENAFSLIPVDCDIYCLSGLITTFKWQAALAKKIKAEIGKPIISGGGLASNLKEKLLDFIPELGIVFSGEGETSLGCLLRDLPETRLVFTPAVCDNLALVPDWENVVGIETYIRNPIWGGVAKNSSYIPFQMLRSLNMVTSRGCPFGCMFCSKDACGGRNYRTRTAEHVALEFNKLVTTYHLDFIGFVDDNMTADKARLRHMSNYPLLAKWGCHSRFDAFNNEQDLIDIKALGCEYLGFGGESANKEILASMRKNNNPEHMIRVLGWCRKTGVHPNVTWMMGWPGETRAQVRETAQFILQYAPENKNLFVATAYPGTGLWDMVESQVLGKYGNLRNYVEQLGDATLPVMNYSAMPDEEFNEVVAMVRSGELESL